MKKLLPQAKIVKRKTLKKVFLIAAVFSTFTLSCYANTDINQQYEDALIAFHNEKISTSIIHLKGILQQSEHLPSRILLAQALLAQGNGDLAEIELTKAQAYNADRNRLVTLFAHAYLLQHKYEKVLNVTKPGSRGNKVETELLIFKGQAQIGQKRYRSADVTFTEALILSPDNQLALLGRAQIALISLKPERALQYVERSLLNPKPFINGFILKANILSQLGEVEKALNAINKALIIDNKHLSAQLTKAMLHINLNEYALAEPHVDIILNEIPNEPRAGYLKALINANLSTTKESLGSKKLTEVINTLAAVPDEVMKNTPDYYYLAGLTNFQYGNLVDAKRYLEKYLTYVDSHLDSIRMIAQIELQAGNSISAKNLLKKANLTHPNNANILTLLGMAYLQLNDPKKAESYFKSVLKLHPDSEVGISNLARSKMQSGEYQSAIDALLSIKGNTVNQVQIKLLLIDSFESNKAIDKAITIALELVTQFPDDSYFQQRIGSLYGWNKQIAQARDAFQKSLSLDNSNIAAIVHLARMDIIENNYQSARTFLEKKLLEFPQNALIMAEISDAYMYENNIAEALTWSAKAHSASINNYYILSKYANALAKSDQMDKAIETVDLFIGQNSNISEALRLIAGLYQSQNKHEQAILALRDYVRKSANKASASIFLAKAQLLAGDSSGAIQSYKKAIVADDSSIPAHIGLLNLLIKRKNEPFALSLIANILTLTKSTSLEQVLLGDLYLSLNDIKKSKKHYLAALKLSDQKQAILGLYQSFKSEKNLLPVIPYLHEWLEKYPDDLAVEISLADSYKHADKLQQAAEQYEKLLTKHGKMPILLNNAANIYFDLNNTELARVYAKEAYSYLKENVAIIDTYAWIESRLGNHKEALSLFRYALTKDYDNAEIKYHLAVTLQKLNRIAEAKNFLMEAVDSKQFFPEKEKAKKLLTMW